MKKGCAWRNIWQKGRQSNEKIENRCFVWRLFPGVIGRICMDQMIVDITDLPDVKSGDIAVFIGKSGQYEITAYDLAEASGTITNELLSRLGSRLNRL